MAGETISPNMNLPIPGVGVTDGPQYADDNNACFSLIDAHDHTSGNGVPITPSGLNINSNLPFNGFSATSLLAAVFNSQLSALVGTNFASVVGGNLYFNDGSGNQIPITAGGGVAGSPGSIGSLTAPAAATYSSGSKTFLWTADSSKAAAMDNGAVTIRETNVASAKGITLASPTALAADFQLTLPAALPASTRYFTSSSSGAMTFSTADQIGSAMTSTGANAIGSSMTSTGANAVAASRTRDTDASTVGIGGVARSSSCGNFSTSSSSLIAVTNLSVTITTSGRPVFIGLISDGANNPGSGSNGGYLEAGTTGGICEFSIKRDAVQIARSPFGSSGNVTIMPASSCYVIDSIGAGTYTYTFLVSIISNANVFVWNSILTAYEL